MSAVAETPAPGAGLRVLERFRAHRLAMFGAVTIVTLTLACFLGPFILPFNGVSKGW